MQGLMEIEKRGFPSRRRRILIGVALGATWLAWFSAFHDLFCAVAGFPVDLAPPSYIVGSVVLSTLGICWLSAADWMPVPWYPSPMNSVGRSRFTIPAQPMPAENFSCQPGPFCVMQAMIWKTMWPHNRSTPLS